MTADAKERLISKLAAAGSFAVGALFLVTAYAKLRPQAGFPWTFDSIRVSLSFFAFDVEAYKILPPNMVDIVADVLPFFELVLGFWLISRLAARISVLIATATMLLFFSAQLSVYLRNMKIPCGCGFFPGEVIGPISLTIDAILLLFCTALTIGTFRSQSIQQNVASVSIPAKA